MRAVKEWVAKHDDQRIPPRVRLRVFDKTSGHCDTCHRKIGPTDKWQADHVIALCNGGEHREGNLIPRCSWCHSQKTKLDVAAKAVTARLRKRHLGIKKPESALARKWKWAKRIKAERAGRDDPPRIGMRDEQPLAKSSRRLLAPANRS